jgi:hypothetical protein
VQSAKNIPFLKKKVVLGKIDRKAALANSETLKNSRTTPCHREVTPVRRRLTSGRDRVLKEKGHFLPLVIGSLIRYSPYDF